MKIDTFVQLINTLRQNQMDDDTDPSNQLLQQYATPYDTITQGDSITVVSWSTSSPKVWGTGATYSVIDTAGTSRQFPSCGWVWTSGGIYGDSTALVNAVTGLTFANVTGVSVSGTTITKTGATAGWNAGANTNQQWNGGDGYVTTTASETNTDRMFGLAKPSSVGSGHAYSEMSYAINLTASGSLQIYEGATVIGKFGSYSNGDVLKIVIECGVAKYYKNATLLYTSAKVPTYPMVVDTSLYTTNATVQNLTFGCNK